jgi:thiol-disulfide isomerase/thioredoxin
MVSGVFPGGRASLARLAAGAAVVALALLALWQSGLLFPDDEGLDPSAPDLDPADASVTTPSIAGYEVGLKPGSLAPDFEFSDFEGRRQRLSDYRGRAVAINFWASWCGPCEAEMPDLAQALRRYPTLAIIGMNNGESYRTAQRFLEKVQVELTAFGFDPQQAVVRRYAVDGMPTTYFIDANGIVTRIVTGALNERLLQSAIEEAIIGWGRVQAAP